MKKYRVTKFYHYAEMYDVEAETEAEAIAIVDMGEVEEDDIFQEFDFHEVQEITK